MTSIREKSIDYLSRREHSRLELKQKLLSKQFSSDEVDAELDFLIAKDLQSDERFVHAYVRSRKQAGFGPKRIECELRERGVNEAFIAAAVDSRAPEWEMQMMAVWRRKFPNPAQHKPQQFRFLSYRGYLTEMINKLLFLTC